MTAPASPVKLEAPGGGVPWWQRLAGKWVLLPYYSARLSWFAAGERLARDGRYLLRLAEGREAPELERRVLVPPQIGLEDSSRFWSYAMVLEHLVIIGDAAAELVIELTHGRVPAGAVRTEDLKPAGAMSAQEAQDTYSAFLDRFVRRTSEEVGDPRSTTRFAHPWFGPLRAHQWMAFLPFHQQIHIRQARRILDAPAQFR